MRVSNKRLPLSKISLALTCAMLVNGCAVDPRTGQPSFKETFNSDDPCANNSRNVGMALGTLIGAVAGHQLDKRSGKFVGAGLGALIGGMVGADMDKRRCELAKVAQQYNLDVSFAVVDSQGATVDHDVLRSNRNATEIKNSAIGTVVSIRDQTAGGGHFESGSDELTPRAKEYFAAIARSYNTRKAAEGIENRQAREDYIRQVASRKLLLVGHTDDTGSSKLNAELSERRAKAVASFLGTQGIPVDSLYFQGAGESYPIADNSTEDGRGKNRRVEFVELSDNANLKKYLDARKPKYEYYRTAESATAKASTAGNTSPLASAAPKTNAVNTAPAKRNADSANRRTDTVSTQTKQKQDTAPVLASPANERSYIDFGGAPLNQTIAVANVGKLATRKSLFSLISSAHADDSAVLRDCTQDRPRVSGAVKSLRDGRQYDTNEHLPGLYGKTWTDKVNGHQVVINRVSVLRNEVAVAQLPEFKVYTNYNPEKNRNANPDVTISPQVNTYLGSNGVLYRMFINGSAGIQCADILFADDGAPAARAAKIVYRHDSQSYVADFKPRRYQE
jgi:outer membrane protein OmpA-like peptidoglycan-associated protein